MEKVELDGYDVGVAETEEALRAEVSGVCRTYYLQVWNEALNQVRVEASSALRRTKNVYYPSTIRASIPSSSEVEAALKNLSPSKDASAKAFPSPNSPPKEAKQAGVVEKEKETTKEVAPEAPKPPTAPKDSSKEGRVSRSQEIVLATFPIPTKEDSKGKGPAATTAATAKPTKCAFGYNLFY